MSSIKQRKNNNKIVNSNTSQKDIATDKLNGTNNTEITDSSDNLTIPFSLCLELIVIFIFSFSILQATVYPSISGGDSGELAVTACNLGVAHPPGYPTFSMLGHLFIKLIPYGNNAYRLNIGNCILTSLTCCNMYITILLLLTFFKPYNILSKIISLSCSLSFIFTPTVWLYAIQSEVFGLNNFILSLLSMLTVIFSLYPTHNIAYIGSFVCGLATTNQHTCIFTLISTSIGVLLYGLLQSKTFWSIKSLIFMFISFIFGCSPYLYLPWSSSQGIMDSWGETASISGFMHHFLRREYGTFQLAADVEDKIGLIGRLIVYAKASFDEMLGSTPLALLGLILLWILVPKLSKLRWNPVYFSCLVFGFSFILYVLVFHYLANLDLTPLFFGVQARFWQQANLYLYIFVGLGYYLMYIFISHNFKFSGSALVFIFSSLPLVALFIQIYRGYYIHDHSSTTIFPKFGAKFLQTIEENSLVLLNGDISNNVMKYLQQCDGMRPDVDLVSLQLLTWEWFVPVQKHNYPKVKFPGIRYHPSAPGGFSIAKFLNRNKHRPIYLCGPWKDGDPTHEKFTTYAYGSCDRIYKKDTVVDISAHLEKAYKAVVSVAEINNFDSIRFTPDTWEYIVYNDVLSRQAHFASLAGYYAGFEKDPIKKERMIVLAVKTYDDLFGYNSNSTLTLIHDIPKSEYRSAGVCYGTYSATLGSNKKLSELYSKRLYYAWKKFTILEPADSEISKYVTAQINPYLSKKIELD